MPTFIDLVLLTLCLTAFALSIILSSALTASRLTTLRSSEHDCENQDLSFNHHHGPIINEETYRPLLLEESQQDPLKDYPFGRRFVPRTIIVSAKRGTSKRQEVANRDVLRPLLEEADWAEGLYGTVGRREPRVGEKRKREKGREGVGREKRVRVACQEDGDGEL